MDEIDGGFVEHDVEVVVGWFENADENGVFIDGGDVAIVGDEGDGSINNSDPCERIKSSSGLNVFDSSCDKIKFESSLHVSSFSA